ncbi:MAG: zinc ABC transporter substrate-binding protein, partial [Acidimicrobiaceae bacterium]|nr:zinc ABC transporter substrate-binding protein [Acidimicrobiaceae bacterium]
MQVDEDAPTIVATTGIWADVVSNVACGGLANVEALIPVGGDPHGYEPSLQDRGRMEDAALVVANGLALEERLLDTLESVAEAGTPVFEVAEAVDTIPYSFGSGHDDHEGHDHDEHSDEESH